MPLAAVLVIVAALHGPAPAGALSVDPSEGYQWPLAEGARVLRSFDAPAGPYGPGHRGVDLVPATRSRVVVSPASGVVTFARNVAGKPVVTVAHSATTRSTLEPVAARVVVGQQVTAGDVVGVLDLAGASHCAAAACLHWGVLVNGVYVDPVSMIAPVPIVLLPWATAGQRRG